VIAHGPVIDLAVDGVLQRLALAVALDAGVVGMDVILPRRIEDFESNRGYYNLLTLFVFFLVEMCMCK
jgi:hypothetical protein